ncbi:hypothetical protein EVAR_52922_1 [Eumeta japonica]|uniref:Uncharacterized protein n=1 Tax=Eumeta variegata TaxID=151549 RepID=A0A4C1Y8Q5_EUMVA|nr:hypothetical protein EVAR_52922_1 [Eumeta japonica]
MRCSLHYRCIPKLHPPSRLMQALAAAGRRAQGPNDTVAKAARARTRRGRHHRYLSPGEREYEIQTLALSNMMRSLKPISPDIQASHATDVGCQCFASPARVCTSARG